jgi:hypothetical protein
VPTNNYDSWMVEVSPDSGELGNTQFVDIYIYIIQKLFSGLISGVKDMTHIHCGCLLGILQLYMLFIMLKLQSP